MENDEEVKKRAVVPRTTWMMRIIWMILGVFLLTTVISQIVIHFYSPVRTEVVSLYTSSSSVLFKGVYVRNEKLFHYDGSGVVSYTLSDGSKLAKNSVVAKVYATQNDISIQSQIDELNRQIDVLNDAQELVGSDSSQLEAFSNQIYEEHAKLLQYIGSGDFSKAAEMKNGFLNLLCKKQIVKGAETGYSDKIEALRAQVKTLEAQISSAPKDLVIGETGYFVSVVDGYENTLNYETLSSLTKEDIEKIIETPVLQTESDVIGKFIDGYQWKFVGIIDDIKLSGIFAGASVKLRAGSSPNPLSAKIETITKLGDGTSIVIFSSDTLNAEYVDQRVSQFRLLIDENTGIRIPSDAIRFDESGEKGVYVLSGVEVKFRKIDVIYSEDDFVLVADTTSKSGYVSLYDSVVIGGKDLYDGKIIY